MTLSSRIGYLIGIGAAVLFAIHDNQGQATHTTQQETRPESRRTTHPTSRSTTTPDSLNTRVYRRRTGAEWFRLVKEGDLRERAEACRTLADLLLGGTSFSSPEPTTDDLIRWKRHIQAKGVSQDATAVVSILVHALSDSEPTVRAAAAYALGVIGPSSVQAAPFLKTALSDADEVSIHAARAFYIVTIEAELPLQTCLRLLRSATPDIRRMAVHNIGLFLPASKSVQEEIRAVSMSDPDPNVRQACGVLLAAMDKLK